MATAQQVLNTLYKAARRSVSGMLELASMFNFGDPHLSGNTATDAAFDEICYFHLVGCPKEADGTVSDAELAKVMLNLHERLNKSIKLGLQTVEPPPEEQTKSRDEEADDEVWASLSKRPGGDA